MALRLTPDDDDFHAPPPGAWWFHETCWFSFFVPERRLGGWIYNYVRPTIGIGGGGCWVWDDGAFAHWEVPYYACYSSLRLPGERDLRDFTFPSGVAVTALAPLTAYRLRYHDRDWIDLDLEFRAVMEPWVTLGGEEPRQPVHFDQLGRVRGEVDLHGERLAVDCLAIRDRSWLLRPERWKVGGGRVYTSAACSAAHHLLATGDPDDLRGYLARDGQVAPLVGGTRRIERDGDHGYVTAVEIQAADDRGRAARAVGRPVSRMAMPIPGVHGVCWTSLVEWEVDGEPGWGEDQEPWPIMEWSRRHRGG